MKKAVQNMVLLFLACAVSFGQSLSAADREKGIQYLEKTRDGVIAATKGLSEAQWNFKPAPDRWSVAETLEHIVVTENYLFQMVTDQVMKSPAGAPDRDVAKLDELVVARISDRSHKAKAPPPVVPKGRWSPSETLDRFLQTRAKTIAYLQSAPDLRDHVMNSPIQQPLDGYEWLLYIGAHSERHTKQILEVKADANFPKKQ